MGMDRGQGCNASSDHGGAEIRAAEADVAEQVVIELQELRVHAAPAGAVEQGGNEGGHFGQSFEVGLATGLGAFARGSQVFGDAVFRDKAARAVGVTIAAMQDQAREQSFSQIGHFVLVLGRFDRACVRTGGLLGAVD